MFLNINLLFIMFLRIKQINIISNNFIQKMYSRQEFKYIKFQNILLNILPINYIFNIDIQFHLVSKLFLVI